jgi:hypothetical protein
VCAACPSSQLNNCAGNLLTYIVFRHLHSTTALYIGFTIVAAAGTAMLLLLEPSPGEVTGDSTAITPLLPLADGSPTSGSKRGDTSAVESPTPSASLWRRTWRGAVDAASLLRQWNMLLMLPLFFFSGLELAFWTGEFTQLLHSSVIGLVLSLSGVGEIVGGVVFGRLSDAVGRSVSLVCGSIVYGVALLIACNIKRHVWCDATVGGAPVVAYVAALLFGAADSCFNTNSYAMCSQMFITSRRRRTVAAVAVAQVECDGVAADVHAHDAPSTCEGVGDASGCDCGGGGDCAHCNVDDDDGDDGDAMTTVGAFAIFQFAQNLGGGVWYWVSLQLPMHNTPHREGTFTQVYVQAGILALSTLAFVYVEFAFQRSLK